MIEAGRAAWPDVTLDDDVFGAFVREREREGGKAPLRAADLWLCCACLRGDPTAQRALDEKFLGRLPSLLGSAGSRDLLAELLQALRVQLLVGKDGDPGTLARYAGRGDLLSWLRVVATRELLRLKSKAERSPRAGTEEIAALADGAGDAELDHVRRSHRELFRAAFADAVAALPAEDRDLLRRQVVRGEGIDELAARLSIHRATAARRLERARERLREAVHGLLRERLGVGDSGLESALRLVDSGFDASVERVLVEAGPAPRRPRRR